MKKMNKRNRLRYLNEILGFKSSSLVMGGGGGFLVAPKEMAAL